MNFYDLGYMYFINILAFMQVFGEELNQSCVQIQEVTYINESKLCKVAINIMIIKKICLFINRFILNFTRNLIQTEISHNFDCRKLLIPK